MSEQITKTWVIVSSIKDNTKPIDLEMITPQIIQLVDEWHSKGKMMLSGPFDNNLSSMAVFEGTNEEAQELYKKYQDICSGILTYELYQWNVLPILSVLNKN